MTVAEEVLEIACQGEALPGVLSLPAGTAKDTAVLIVVGGPQYRAGSHRQFVQSARAWAAAGWPVLRFDVRGMGDATGEPRGFEALDDDIAAALDALEHRLPGLRRVVLFGLCDGASAALMYCARRRDGRIGGLCLLNPWLRSEQSLARTHLKHYYGQRLLQREFWVKLLSGRLAMSALSGLLQNVRTSRRAASGASDGGDFRQLMARGWRQFPGPILLVISAADLTAKEFVDGVQAMPEWSGLLTQPRVVRHDVREADHTLSRREHRRQVDDVIEHWLNSVAVGHDVTLAGR